MNRSLLKKCLHESRLLLGACIVALYSFCWARVWVVAQFEMSRFKAIIEQFRQYERFSPVPFEQMFTYAGRIAMTYDEPIVVACMTLWAISRGSDVVSGELGRGTMEMLLAQPIRRAEVLISNAAVTICGAALLAASTWFGIWSGVQTNHVKQPAPPASITIPFLNIEISNPLADPETMIVPMTDVVDTTVFVPAAINLFALGVFLAGFSALMSAWDRYRWRTIGLVVGVYIFQMIIKLLALASDRFAWMSCVTFFTAYEPEAYVSTAVNQPGAEWHFVLYDTAGKFQDIGPVGYDLILISLGIICYAGAIVIFNRRDLPAPL